MISINDHLDKIVCNMRGVSPRVSYFSSLLSIIEDECNCTFNSSDFIIMSAAEHYAVFNHFKTFSNVFTLATVPSIGNNNTHLVILADSIIPLDNADYPRGIAINQDSFHLLYNPLISKKFRKWTPLTLNYKGIKPKPINNRTFSLNQENVIWHINNIIETSDTLFVAISDINKYLYKESLSQIAKPRLHYLSLERVVMKFLLTLLQKGDDPFCEEFIFSNLERTFESLYGVRTCWGDNKGSFLFWHQFEGKLFPCRLYCRNYIESDVKRFELSKESLINSLMNFELIPGGFLSLSLASIVPNFPTIGGFPQYHFLQKMIDYIVRNSDLEVDNRINNFNWGVHPEIGESFCLNMGSCSTVFLAANPLPETVIRNYCKSNNIII